jgi:hypothetical protein
VTYFRFSSPLIVQHKLQVRQRTAKTAELEANTERNMFHSSLQFLAEKFFAPINIEGVTRLIQAAIDVNLNVQWPLELPHLNKNITSVAFSQFA